MKTLNEIGRIVTYLAMARNSSHQAEQGHRKVGPMGCQRDIAQQIVDQRHFAFNLLRGYQGDRYNIPRR